MKIIILKVGHHQVTGSAPLTVVFSVWITSRCKRNEYLGGIGNVLPGTEKGKNATLISSRNLVYLYRLTCRQNMTAR